MRLGDHTALDRAQGTMTMETMAPVKSMDGRPSAYIAVAVAAAVLALFLLNRFVAPIPIFDGISADQAVVIAREFAVAGQASDELIREVRTGAPTVAGSRWRVEVDLSVIYGPPSGATPDPSLSPIWIYYQIDVDRSSGAATIYVQG